MRQPEASAPRDVCAAERCDCATHESRADSQPTEPDDTPSTGPWFSHVRVT
jgi:hypothetical protein